MCAKCFVIASCGSMPRDNRCVYMAHVCCSDYVEVCGNVCHCRVFCTRDAWVCLLLCKEEGSCYCLPTPMTLARGGSPMFPLVVHQPASPSIWPAVQSPRRGLSTNPGVTMWCVCGCS